MQPHIEGAIFGSVATLVIVGFWLIGTGLKEAAEMKKRRASLRVVTTDEAVENGGGG